jgi:hypothetical protein
MTIELGPEHVRALNKARNAVLAEQRKYERAAETYGKRDQLRTEESMTAEAWACRQVAQFLAELRDAVKTRESETPA